MKFRKFKTSEEEKEFFTTLRKRVYKKLENEYSKYGGVAFWFKGLFWITVSYTAYAFLLSVDTYLTFWVLYFVFQISGLLIGFSLGHDASHNTAFKNKQANQILHFFSFLTVGIDPLLWGLRHIRSHHLYANVEGSDIDIDKNPFLRLAPSHPWSRKHAYQHIYAPFVYMLALLHSVFVGDWIYLFSKEYEWMRKGIASSQLYVRYFLFKILYFSLVLVVPILFSEFSIELIVLAYISTSAFTSMVFVVMLVGTHFFDEAEYYQPLTDELQSSWAIHQLKTSCDWNPNNKFARFLSGGSNCHAAHHLFPSICHTNYNQINEVIEKTTSEFNVPYHKKSLLEMMKSHFKHLKNMGKLRAKEEKGADKTTGR
ncbi:fatty acid desaturase [Dokdonia pacifica]|uniref:Linoleoyl-CoA desaturase n=1 Tax=Dokdonia pacifica TaxID=1627892 RepID=A0A239C3S4_9FLAO|nr:acyl-CoA desaturase [Dokdonia pacifica]GGG26646.1 fatty acid desaturase [Dokdonia pacifica]SNS14907.1 linoleoyl-CoA desaturase [Dokdonia pacifica]